MSENENENDGSISKGKERKGKERKRTKRNRLKVIDVFGELRGGHLGMLREPILCEQLQKKGNGRLKTEHEKRTRKHETGPKEKEKKDQKRVEDKPHGDGCCGRDRIREE